MAKVWYSTYSLSRIRIGALLRFDFGDEIGHSDCHPWPELGDATLDRQLTEFVSGNPSPLLMNSLQFARTEAQYRKESRNLFEGLSIPESHYLVTREDQAFPANLERVAALGYTKVKIKTKDLEWSQLIRLLREAPAELKFRLDFNASLTASELQAFLWELGDLMERLDYLEDPTPDLEIPFLPDNVIVALDQGVERVLGMPQTLWPTVLIIKPAIVTPSTMQILFHEHTGRTVVTSYLDHPIGQLYAAFVAARNGITETCGLLSQNAYDPSAFSELLGRGPKLKTPFDNGLKDPGLGLDPFLNSINWKELGEIDV